MILDKITLHAQSTGLFQHSAVVTNYKKFLIEEKKFWKKIVTLNYDSNKPPEIL